MIEFLKYPKMKNSYAIEPDDFGKTTVFYSSEKIDGSNTQIDIHLTNGVVDEIKVGSRNKFIEEDCKEALGKVYNFVPKVKELVAQNANNIPTLSEKPNATLYVYGEIFGSKIQTTSYDVTKNGDVDYRIFDCFVKADENKGYFQLGYESLKAIFGDLVAPLKDKGTLEELLDKPLGRESQYGAPLEEGDVYHTYSGCFYTSKEALQRVNNVKRKHKEFSEISRKHKKSKAPKVFTEEQKKILDELTQYVTERRVENILSHGDIERSPKNIGKLIGATIKDSMEEFAIDHNIPKEDLKPFGKSIGGVAGQVVRKVVLGSEI